MCPLDEQYQHRTAKACPHPSGQSQCEATIVSLSWAGWTWASGLGHTTNQSVPLPRIEASAPTACLCHSKKQARKRCMWAQSLFHWSRHRKGSVSDGGGHHQCGHTGNQCFSHYIDNMWGEAAGKERTRGLLPRASIPDLSDTTEVEAVVIPSSGWVLVHKPGSPICIYVAGFHSTTRELFWGTCYRYRQAIAS